MLPIVPVRLLSASGDWANRETGFCPSSGDSVTNGANPKVGGSNPPLIFRLKTVQAAIVRRRRRAPRAKQLRTDAIRLDRDRPTHGARTCGVRSPRRHAHVAMRTRGNRTQQIDLGKELEVVTRSRRTGLHEILMRISGETRHLKDVQHVVHVALRQAIRRDGAQQIRVVESCWAHHFTLRIAEKDRKISLENRPPRSSPRFRAADRRLTENTKWAAISNLSTANMRHPEEAGMPFSRREFVRKLGVGGAGIAAASHVIGYGREDLLALVGTEQARGGGQRSAPASGPMIRLSSNENLRGPGPRILEVLRTHPSRDLGLGYPPPNVGNFVDVIAAWHGAKSENVIISTGSGEILTAAVMAYCAGAKTLVTGDPSYGSPAQTAQRIKAPVKFIAVNPKTLALDLEGMIRAAIGTGLVFLCNPNNPTSSVQTTANLEQTVRTIKQRSPDTGILIDEAYLDTRPCQVPARW